jgi:hypothetical protein
MMHDQTTYTNERTCTAGFDRTVDNKTEFGSDEEQVINLDSQSPKLSPTQSPTRVVDLCDDTPVRMHHRQLNLDDFRFDECEGKGSSFSKESAVSMRS